MTKIEPRDGRSWDEIFEQNENTPDGERAVANSALYLLAANMGVLPGHSKRLSKNNRKRLYGKILWNYLEEKPSNSMHDASKEVSKVYFAYFLKKAIESDPIVRRY
jgi:hypothetical protein